MIKVELPVLSVSHALETAPLNTGFARAVIEGHVDGELWTDQLDEPRVFYALHSYGMSLVWGDAVGDRFETIIHHLLNRADRPEIEWLRIDPRWQRLDWDQQLGAVEETQSIDTVCTRYTCANFRFVSERFQNASLESVLPDGWYLRPATIDDFELAGDLVPGRFWQKCTPIYRSWRRLVR